MILVFIETNITDASSIIWEKLDETSCAAVADQDCANEDPGCTWNQVETGPNYLIDTAGQYRLTLNYTGGCFNQFYFNVYTNLLVPTVTSQEIFIVQLQERLLLEVYQVDTNIVLMVLIIKLVIHLL